VVVLPIDRPLAVSFEAGAPLIVVGRGLLDLPTAPPPLNNAIHVALYLPGVVAATTVAPGLYRWGGQLHDLVAMAGRCAV